MINVLWNCFKHKHFTVAWLTWVKVSFLLLQVLPEINICDFSTLDLDKDYDVDEEELITLIQMSGLEELEDLFEKVDNNGGK